MLVDMKTKLNIITKRNILSRIRYLYPLVIVGFLKSVYFCASYNPTITYFYLFKEVIIQSGCLPV
jgi:hypothetical protein